MQHLQCTFDKPQSLKPAIHDSQTHIGFQEIGFFKKIDAQTTQLNLTIFCSWTQPHKTFSATATGYVGSVLEMPSSPVPVSVYADAHFKVHWKDNQQTNVG